MLNARNHLSLNVLLLLVALAGCAENDEQDRPAVPPTETAAPPGQSTPDNVSVLSNPDTAGWTAGLTAQPGSEVATLTAVRTATHDEYERIVFEFPDGLPGYRVEYIDRPVRQCGSGDVVELPGEGWLSIRLEPANAHTEAGQPTIADRNRVLSYQNLKALRLICDFEAQVEWIAAVASPNPYRTLELRAPSRLVVDIRK
jgi:hypothetical protein